MPGENDTPSAASKAQDQQLVALDELSVDQCNVLKMCAESSHKEFQVTVASHSQFKDTKFWDRLIETAKRKKLSPLAYAEQYLIDRK